ncbi:hypothetical protein [Abyssalbus ytuae]|uniref:Uncharacterized protein n=1 Tax=Abyssalbus ytuae TaxID=2926907 RepID=A0A9E7CTP9_9FLAO|nr:hypothetical protein [Abyssalbus ytuae]UOB16572.1 hypothetical protein MQE35_12605 [Abyssalbus ytuae]
MNESLGDGYSVVDRRFNKDNFDHYSESVFGKKHDPEICKDVVKYVITSHAIPIYKDQTVYVMTDSGKTFECIHKPEN